MKMVCAMPYSKTINNMNIPEGKNHGEIVLNPVELRFVWCAEQAHAPFASFTRDFFESGSTEDLQQHFISNNKEWRPLALITRPLPCAGNFVRQAACSS